jgi:large subunit ribosomal protein L24
LLPKWFKEKTLARIKKGDMVAVIAGKDKGKRGKTLKVFPARDKVIVEKINLIKRHTKRKSQGEQGGIIEKEAPLHLSNIMFFCGKCNRPTRIGKKILSDGRRVRICRKCGEVVDRT